jgi:hypothetical protein
MEFEPIHGYDGYYEISKEGYVYSYLRGKILRFRFDGCGYRRVSLKGKDQSIHRLVAKTYLETFKDDLEVNHIDGNRLNNNVINLEMIIHKENMRHTFKLGLVNYRKGEKSYLSKITENDVIQIQQLWKDTNLTQAEIANKFDCKRSNICEIVRGKSWKYLL